MRRFIFLADSLGYKMLLHRAGANDSVETLQRIKRVVIGNISTLSFAKKLFIYSRVAEQGVSHVFQIA